MLSERYFDKCYKIIAKTTLRFQIITIFLATEKKSLANIINVCKRDSNVFKRGFEMTEKRQTKQMAELINLAREMHSNDQACFSVKSDWDKHL